MQLYQKIFEHLQFCSDEVFLKLKFPVQMFLMVIRSDKLYGEGSPRKLCLHLLENLPTGHHCQEVCGQWWSEDSSPGEMVWLVLLPPPSAPLTAALFCSLLKAKTVFNTPAYLAWAFPPGSDLRPEFNRIVRRLLEVKLLLENFSSDWDVSQGGFIDHWLSGVLHSSGSGRQQKVREVKWSGLHCDLRRTMEDNTPRLRYRDLLWIIFVRPLGFSLSASSWRVLWLFSRSSVAVRQNKKILFT